MDVGWNNTGFSDFLAHVEMAAVDSGSVTQRGSNNAGRADGSSFLISHSPIDNGLQKTSYSSMLLDLDLNIPIESNPWDDDSNYQPHIPQYEFPGLYRCSYDLNSPPETFADIASNGSLPFQFAPETPDVGKRAQQSQHYEIGNIFQEEGSYLVEKNKKQDAVDQIGHNASGLYCEETILQFGTDSTSIAASAQLKEKDVLDKAEEATGIDLHKTPAQTAKRRKIRPRVVLEGKAQKTPKSNVKEKLNDSEAKKTPKSNVKGKSKDAEAKKTPKSNVKEKPNVENQSWKRKYTRKNESKSSNAPSSDVVGDATTDQVAIKSCKRKLTFQYEGTRLALLAGSELPLPDTCTGINCSAGTKATQQLAQGREAAVENFSAVEFDLNVSCTEILEGYTFLPEKLSNCEVLQTRNTHGNPENDVLKVYKRKRTENNHDTVDSSLFNSVSSVLHGTREATGCRQSDVNASPFASYTTGPLELAWPLYDLIDGSSGFSVAEQNAVVPYGGDGQMVPYEGLFDPIKKRLPRAKVDLDPEDDRVWKLLMGIDTSNGAEGTSEDKEEWWEERRRLFRGRADSFTSRMHLILGNRRFSKWNGSVLDSVIGVYLTQNVSDHLSSSAFISLAARFPLKSTCYKGPDILVEEPEVCTVDSDDPINWQEKMPCKPVSVQGFVAHHKAEPVDERVIGNCKESFESNVGDGSMDDISKGSHIDICESGKMCHESLERRIGTVTTETGCGSSVEAEDKRESVVLSSQDSVVSSQNLSTGRGSVFEDNERRVLENVVSFQDSVNSPILSTDERVSSCSETDSTTCCTCKSSSDSTYIEDLQISGASCACEHTSLEKEESCSNLQGVQNKIFQHESTPLVKPGIVVDPLAQRDNIMQQAHSNLTNFQGETLHGAESTLLVDKSTYIDDKVVEPNSREQLYSTNKLSDETTANVSKTKGSLEEEEKKPFDWDGLRKEVYRKGLKREKTKKTMDSLDWEAVRCADVGEIAKVIKERGMSNILAGRIKDFLNRLVTEHESLDLEWLRDVPPDKAKDYLLSIKGVGLKSTECVRLLTLHHHAFPVDTNVGRIAVRLGWVPLQPLPESLQLHLLEMYPMMESIQKYLWPRLCTLDQPTLYELHYQMITFGKVFCTKLKPNCNACPMKAECRHFASQYASARLALPGPEEKGIVTSFSLPANQNPATMATETMPVRLLEADPLSETILRRNECEPIIEEPETIEDEYTELIESDIEDAIYECPNEIPSINLNLEEFTLNLQNYQQENNMDVQEGEVSKALVAVSSQVAAIPIPKLKNVNRLRTEHRVYELPDSHPLLEGVARRDPDDHCSYLLAIWTPGETAESFQPPERCCSSQESSSLCNEKTCFSCNSIHEANTQTVRGTLLIPCRTAMRGSFPLNGTYFQVNEVFADHETSLNPINVPRTWIWNLDRRSVLFGTSVSTIFKGLSMEKIQSCFRKGYVCVRGFDQKMRVPRPLVGRLHKSASKIIKNKTTNSRS